MWLFVGKTRIKIGEYVKLNNSVIERIQKRESYKNFKKSYEKEIVNCLELQCIPDDELVYGYICVLDAIVYSCHGRNPLLFRTDPDNEESLEMIVSILKPMIQKLKIPKKYADDFLYTHKAYLLNLFLLTELSDIFQKTSLCLKHYIQDNLGTVYNAWHSYLDNKEYRNLISEKYLDDVCVKLAMISSQFLYSKKSKIKKILFTFSGESGFVAYLETMAYSLFPRDVETVFYSSNRITESLVRELEPDLIVCNFQNLNLIHQCPLYRLSHIPTSKEWTFLRENVLNPNSKLMIN